MKEYLERLKQLDGLDPERAHSEADDILIEALRELGQGGLADEWLRQSHRWWWA